MAIGVVVDLSRIRAEIVARQVRIVREIQLEVVERDQRRAVAVVDVGPELPVHILVFPVADQDGRDLTQQDRVGPGAGLGVELAGAVGVVALLVCGLLVVALEPDEGIEDTGTRSTEAGVCVTDVLDDGSVVECGFLKAGSVCYPKVYVGRRMDGY